MIFSGVMRRLDTNDTRRSLRIMEDHIRSMQEQLEYTLYNLDSTNVTSIDPGVTSIGGDGMSISGESLALYGSGGERIVMGRQGSAFRMELAGKGGRSAVYLDGGGRVCVGPEAAVYIDCGTWE